MIELDVLWKIIQQANGSPFNLIEAIFSKTNPPMEWDCTIYPPRLFYGFLRIWLPI